MTTKDSNSTDAEARASMPEVMRTITRQMSAMLGLEPAGVSAVESTEQGWRANLEVVELERIPETTSVMATYRVDADGRGEVVGYERIRRYSRGQVDR